MGSEKERVCAGCGNSLEDSSWGGDCTWCLLQLGLTKARPSLSTFSSSCSQDDGSVEPLPGQEVLTRFGDYELVSEIARGGMGVVYRARQLSLGRQVAVKLILAGQLATRESLERFRLEAQSAARLHHPGIVRIYEIGEFETQYFYSMELIDGESLAECLQEFRLDAKADSISRRTQESCIAELIAKVAKALDFAHRHGVLHRDLKPSNILIDDEGEPHLTDFGLAKLLGTEDSGLSLSNAVLGTPGYVAPEQASGSRHVTIAADVYGLGATLYELLAGQPPFIGSSAMATMMQAIQQDAKSVRSLNPTVSRDLDTIALRCLERDPLHRYGSAAEVADELERFLRNEPIKARSISSREFAWRWCLRNPGIATLLVSLVATFAIGITSVLWQWARAERASTRLAEGVERLRWYAIDDMLRAGQVQRSLAGVAAILRRNPKDERAAMFGMSILEQHNFPVPFAPRVWHDGELSVARLSPNGKTIAIASYDGSVRLWDSQSSAAIGSALQHSAAVTRAEFSPDSQRLAAVTIDHKIHIWRIRDLALEGTIDCQHKLDSLQYSDDGQLILARARQASQVYDLYTQQLLFELPNPPGQIVAATLVGKDSENLKMFVAIEAGEESSLQLWDFKSRKLSTEIHPGPIIHACVSRDLALAASITPHKIILWNLETGTIKKEIETERRLVGIAFSRDSQEFLISGHNDWAQVWATDSGQPITPELPHYYLMNGATFLDDGERVLTWGDDSLAQIWDAKSGARLVEPMLHTNRVRFAEVGRIGSTEVYLTTLSHGKSPNQSLVPGFAQLWRIHNKKMPEDRSRGFDSAGYDGSAVSPDGKWLALAQTTQEVWLLDTATGNTVCGPLKVDGGAWGLAFSPDQTKLICTTSRGQVTIWQIPDGKLMHEPVNINATIQPLELSPDGERFATGSTDGFLRIWDLETGNVLVKLKHGAEINAIAFSPDGKLIASAGEDHRVQVWNSHTGEQAVTLAGHKNEVMRVRFTPDGGRVVTASLDRIGGVWDAETGELIYRLPHNGEVIDVDVSPCGNWIATASRDRTAMIWDAKSGKPHVSSLFHEQSVRNVIFSPDGRSLLTRDFRGLRLWDVAQGIPLTAPMEHLCYAGTGFQTSSGSATFTPDGKAVFVAADAPDALLWQLPQASESIPSWFADFLEAVAGQRYMEGDDMVESVPTSRFLELQAHILNSDATDCYSIWAREWLSGSDNAKH